MLSIKSLFTTALAAVLSCFASLVLAAAPPPQTADLASLVNPFVGTDSGGDTYPGAVAPFGMIQLSPNWDNNGYYYPETKMHGFVVNLLSGDGGANEGQVLMTATTGPVKVDRASTDYTYDHMHESASAGYYQVLMQPFGINAEMTTLTRTGYARFTFPAGQQRNIILPLSYANNPVSGVHVHFADASRITGDVTSHAFNGDGHITVYFVMEFSKPFDDHGTWSGTTLSDGSGDAAQADVNAPVTGFYGSYLASNKKEEVDVRIGISYVDAQGAMNNLKMEMPVNATFAHYRALSAALWDKELSVIDVQGGTIKHNKVFYTALYHALIAPQIADDEDSRYRGFDDKIHSVDSGHTHYYETFSGWDIYRTEFPLFGIIEPTRAQDMAQSIVDMSNQLGYIDRWPQLNQPTGCMNGDPLTVCLTNIWNAGLHNFDIAVAYQSMWKQSQFGNPHNHIDVYQGQSEEANGITIDSDSSVSTALEYFESFAALGHLAEALGKQDDANFLYGRALQYRDFYNTGSGFLQKRNPNGEWDRSFGGYTEGNQWIYLWFVPEDVQGLVDLMGGPTVFDKRLDQFFSENRYDPTNEPDLQAPLFYDYINRPWKTQHIVAETADKCFTDAPGGLAGGGNDDLGTMSAWYILSQLGIYFVDPGVPYVEVTTPRFPKAILHLTSPNGSKQATFEIDTPNAGGANEYIQSTTLNGNPLTKTWFPEAEILGGGTWQVTVGAQPNQSWASSPFDRPYSLSTGFQHIPNNPNLIQVAPDGRTSAQTWKYSNDKPADNWFKPEFDDSSWKSGPGGFGTEDEGVEPRTSWKTDDIWMRRTFTLAVGFKAPQVVLYHDQSAEVYINGIELGHLDGYTHSYDPVILPPAAQASLHAGQNILAVHVNHPGDGRHFADAGLADITWPDNEK
jgi:predicted alpha-1,2-mannosidase